MKKFEVLEYLQSFKDFKKYGFNQYDVNALNDYLCCPPMDKPCSKSSMAMYGFNAHQIHRLDMLVKMVTQQSDVYGDEELRKHLAKLNHKSVSGKVNVKNFEIERSVPQYATIHDVPYERWKLLNGKDGRGLRCKVVKSGNDTTIVEIPQIIAVRKGESTKVKNVGEILSAGDGKMQLKLSNEYITPIECWRYYLANSAPTNENRYLCMLRTGEKFYVLCEEVKNGRLSATASRVTIGFSYGEDTRSENLYKYAVMACLMRCKGEGAKKAYDELRSYKFTGKSSQERLQEIQALQSSDEWKTGGAMNGILNIKYETSGSGMGGDFF